MQTIYIDLSNKTVLPIVYAKQGDVGRKFRIVFTSAGLLYKMPDGARLSVWYDGDSGDGNYTHIGEKDAFQINENIVEVEMITQMLSAPGRGNMCIVLANSEGEQIGSWNITYICEERPGFDSEGATSYFNAFSKVIEAAAKFTVDKTLSKSGSPADAAVTGSRIETEKNQRESEIAVERARINELVAMRTNDGSIRVDLSADGISGYIKTNGFHAYASFTVEDVKLGSAEAWISDYFIPKELCPFTKNGPTYTEWFHAVGKDEIFIEVIQDSQTGMIKLRIYNESEETITGNLYIYGEYALAEPYCNELADIRIGFNGKTYPTAGEAVRGQIQQVIAAQPSAIECTASGTVVSVAEASDAPLRGLTLYGKTTQNGTPTIDNPIGLDSVGGDGGIAVKVIGKNFLDVATAGVYHNNANTPNIDMSITDTGIYLKPIETLSDNWTRWGLWLGTVKELAGKTITLSAKAKTTMANNLPKCFIAAAKIEPTMVREKPRYKDGGYLSSGASQSLKESQQVSNGYVQATYTITGEETMPYVCILFQFSYGGDASIEDWTEWSDIQVEIGDTATAYEPYKEAQRIAISTPDGLPGIPVSSGGNYTDENGQAWICDEIDLARGVYVQRICQVVFDGSTDEKWQIVKQTHSSGFVINRIICSIADLLGNSAVISTHYPSGTYNQTGSKYGIVFTYSDGVGFSIDPEVCSTSAAWCEMLASSPITVQYILEEPIETPLTEEQIAAYKALRTNKPHTVVLNDAGAGMAVSYVADTKTYIDNKIAQVCAAMMNTI